MILLTLFGLRKKDWFEELQMVGEFEIQRPPPYSYDLAISINPNWDEMDKLFPWNCPGYSRVSYSAGKCGKDIVWWHPHVSQYRSYCDDCCPAYDKRMFTIQWQEAKLKVVTRHVFSTKKGKALSKLFKLNQTHQKNLVNAIGLLAWDWYFVKYQVSKRIRKSFIDRIAKEIVEVP